MKRNFECSLFLLLALAACGGTAPKSTISPSNNVPPVEVLETLGEGDEGIVSERDEAPKGEIAEEEEEEPTVAIPPLLPPPPPPEPEPSEEEVESEAEALPEPEAPPAPESEPAPEAERPPEPEVVSEPEAPFSPWPDPRPRVDRDGPVRYCPPAFSLEAAEEGGYLCRQGAAVHTPSRDPQNFPQGVNDPLYCADGYVLFRTDDGGYKCETRYPAIIYHELAADEDIPRLETDPPKDGWRRYCPEGVHLAGSKEGGYHCVQDGIFSDTARAGETAREDLIRYCLRGYELSVLIDGGYKCRFIGDFYHELLPREFIFELRPPLLTRLSPFELRSEAMLQSQRFIRDFCGEDFSPYLEFHQGHSPLILTLPHAGRRRRGNPGTCPNGAIPPDCALCESPEAMIDGRCSDAYAESNTRMVGYRMMERMDEAGEKPSVIISKFIRYFRRKAPRNVAGEPVCWRSYTRLGEYCYPRERADMNRGSREFWNEDGTTSVTPMGETIRMPNRAFADAFGQKVYDCFHSLVRQSLHVTRRNFGLGFLLDIHGNWDPARFNAPLDLYLGSAATASLNNLKRMYGLEDILLGKDGLYSRLVATGRYERGIAWKDHSFWGGYISPTYGYYGWTANSRLSEPDLQNKTDGTDGMIVEIHLDWLDDAESRAQVSADLADTLLHLRRSFICGDGETVRCLRGEN